MYRMLSNECRMFIYNYTVPTDIYTLSLHDALPIYRARERSRHSRPLIRRAIPLRRRRRLESRGDVEPRNGSVAAVDRKSTRLNSSHSQISYAVFCLKKKNQSVE